MGSLENIWRVPTSVSDGIPLDWQQGILEDKIYDQRLWTPSMKLSHESLYPDKTASQTKKRITLP
jgi:hypothetical protein